MLEHTIFHVFNLGELRSRLMLEHAQQMPFLGQPPSPPVSDSWPLALVVGTLDKIFQIQVGNSVLFVYTSHKAT